jgi:glutamate carboxypeptidase
MPSRLPTAPEILDGLREWVETESHTSDLTGVNRMLDLAASGYGRAGARVERIAGRDGYGDHLLITSAWGGDGPGVLVLCHLDTVHPKGTLAQFPMRVDGDRAYGPGIYDMKGGAYLALRAFAALGAAGGGPLPVRLLITSDEEIGSRTSRALIEAEGVRAAHVLVTEPARDGGRIVTGRKGTGRYKVHVRGRPAHSGSRPQDGRSAIAEMARQILVLDGLNEPAAGVSVNIGLIRGGTAANTVPEHCTAEVDLRIATNADAERMEARIKGLVPHDPEITVRVEGQINRPPFVKTAAIAGLLEHARGLAARIGFALEDVHTGGGSDGNFLADRLPVLDGLGVDGAGAHTLEEHLLISSLVPRMRLLHDLMATLR